MIILDTANYTITQLKAKYLKKSTNTLEQVYILFDEVKF